MTNRGFSGHEYHQRWQVGAVFDGLKIHLLKSRRVLRSKTAELVRHECYGWVLAHYAVRWLLHQGATRHRMPHDELSLTGHVQLLRHAPCKSHDRTAKTRVPMDAMPAMVALLARRHHAAGDAAAGVHAAAGGAGAQTGAAPEPLP